MQDSSSSSDSEKKKKKKKDKKKVGIFFLHNEYFIKVLWVLQKPDCMCCDTGWGEGTL